MNYNKDIKDILDLLEKENKVKISLKEDFKQDFNTIISTAWKQEGEKKIIKILYDNKDKILNDETKGKQFLTQIFSQNKALIQNNCSASFIDSVSSLTGQEITESKYIKESKIKENKMYRYYRVQYLNEAQTYVAVPPFAINTLMEHETVLGFALESKQIKTQKGVDYVIEVSEQEFDEVTTDLEGSYGSKPTDGKPQDAAKANFDKVKEEKGATQSDPKKLQESKWNFLFEDNFEKNPATKPTVKTKKLKEDFEQPKEGKFERTSYDSASDWGGEEDGDKCSFCDGKGCKRCEDGKVDGILASADKFPSYTTLNQKLTELIDGNRSALANMKKQANTPDLGADGVIGEAVEPEENEDEFQHMTKTKTIKESKEYVDPVFKVMEKNANEKIDVDETDFNVGDIEETEGYKGLRDFYTQYGLSKEEVVDDTTNDFGSPIKESISAKLNREVNEAEKIGYDEEDSIDESTVLDEQSENEVCPDCNGDGWMAYSCCTQDPVDKDVMMCPVCHEHLGEDECETCNGTGKALTENIIYENDTSDMSIPDATAAMGKSPKKVDVYGEDNENEYIEDKEVLQEKFINFILQNCQNANKYLVNGKFNLKEFANNKSFGYMNLLTTEFKKKDKLKESELNGEFEIDGFDWDKSGVITIQYYYPSDEKDREVKVSEQEFEKYLEDTDPNWEDGNRNYSEEDRVDGESFMNSGTYHDIQDYWNGYSVKQQAIFLKSFLINKRGVSKRL